LTRSQVCQSLRNESFSLLSSALPVKTADAREPRVTSWPSPDTNLNSFFNLISLVFTELTGEFKNENYKHSLVFLDQQQAVVSKATELKLLNPNVEGIKSSFDVPYPQLVSITRGLAFY